MNRSDCFPGAAVCAASLSVFAGLAAGATPGVLAHVPPQTPVYAVIPDTGAFLGMMNCDAAALISGVPGPYDVTGVGYSAAAARLSFVFAMEGPTMKLSRKKWSGVYGMKERFGTMFAEDSATTKHRRYVHQHHAICAKIDEMHLSEFNEDKAFILTTHYEGIETTWLAEMGGSSMLRVRSMAAV